MIAHVMDFLARHSFPFMVAVFLVLVVVIVARENNPRNHW
jgi:hypothetical protein